MAEPVNDFSFDPYQVEEQSLNERLKQAMLKQLRPRPSSDDIVGGFNSAFDRVAGARDEQDVYKRRREMADSYDRSLMDATKGADPQVRDLMMSPATRGVGLERLRDTLKRKSDAEEMDSLRNQFRGGALPNATGAAGGGGDIPSYEEVVAMSLSTNPTIAARGKRLEELYYKPQDPKNNIYAGGRPVPGADAAYGRTQGTAFAASHPQGVAVPNGYGGMTNVPAPGAGPVSALPNAVAAPGATPVGPSPNGPASAPIPPVSGPPTGGSSPFSPPPGMNPEEARIRQGFDRTLGTQGGVVPPQVQLQRDMERMNILQEEAKQYPPQSREGMALRQEMQMTAQRIAKAQNAPQIAAGPGAPPPQGPAPSPMSPISPAQAGGVGVQRPNAGFGNTDPIAQDIYKGTMEGREKGFQKFQEKGSEVPETRAIIDRMKGVGDTYTGMSSLPMALESFGSMLSGGKTDKGRNTEEFNKYSSDLRASIIKQYGTGNSISDADLKATLDRIPNVDQDPRTRAKLIAGIEEDMSRFEWVAPRVRQYVEMGVPLAEAQNRANQDYRAVRAQANPTQAGGKQQALPSATAADPTAPQKESLWEGMTNPEGLAHNALNVAKAPFSGAGWKGFGDAQMNVLRGVGQYLGMSDRGDWAATKAEQERRSADPLYAAGKNFGDIFNPTAFIGGGATTIPKLAVTGAAQAGLQPNESFTGQLVEGAKGGIAGGALGLIGKIFPTITSSVPDLNKYLEKFSSVKPTSAQLNPSSFESKVAAALGVNDAASLAQVQALTRELMKTAGIEGKHLSREGIDATRTKLGKEFDILFPDTKNAVGTVMSTTDQGALRQGFDALMKNQPSVQKFMNNANAPALTRLFGTLTDVKNPIKVNPKDLHEAWKEIGQVAENPQAAAGVRKILKDLIGKGMSKDKLDAFDALNLQYGTLQDIDRIFSRAGTGKGVASGYLAPSKFEAQMGEGPNSSAVTDEAAQLVKQLDLKDYHGLAADVSEPIKLLFSGARNVVGGGLHAADKAIQALPAKKLAERLRNWGITSGQAGIREYTGD
jgi:hypothetical protein